MKHEVKLTLYSDVWGGNAGCSHMVPPGTHCAARRSSPRPARRAPSGHDLLCFRFVPKWSVACPRLRPSSGLVQLKASRVHDEAVIPLNRGCPTNVRPSRHLSQVPGGVAINHNHVTTLGFLYLRLRKSSLCRVTLTPKRRRPLWFFWPLLESTWLKWKMSFLLKKEETLPMSMCSCLLRFNAPFCPEGWGMERVRAERSRLQRAAAPGFADKVRNMYVVVMTTWHLHFSLGDIRFYLPAYCPREICPLRDKVIILKSQ